MMANSAGWVLMGLVYVIVLGVWAVWTYFSIKFFIKATEHYQARLNDRLAKNDQMNEMLAKMDQLVDVLKVK
jgi:hypothetical protein